MDNKNFNKKAIINKVYQKLGFSKNYSSSMIDNFFEILISNLIKNKKIKITSLGTFKVSEKNERIGRNPKTKIETKISARNVIKFKASEIMLKKINSNN